MIRGFVGAAASALMVLVATSASASADESARDIQEALNQYLAGSGVDERLVGGPGSAGYDDGYWIRGGDFLLRTNLTMQARYEAWTWADGASGRQGLPGGPTDGGDLSGFSLPRVTLKFSGEAPCNVRYFVALEFGHHGDDRLDLIRQGVPAGENIGTLQQSLNFDNTREAWIEWRASKRVNVRMGQIGLAATRQLMTGPELQQFVDVSLASALMGSTMPGYTDRNRDHGIAVHGVFGCKDEWSYLFTMTNGDGGDSIRNVLDTRSSDNLAYSIRLNWAFAKPLGYQEGALRADTCSWYGELGAWIFYYEDRRDKPHTVFADSIRYGLDIAVGYGGFSFTGAASIAASELAAGTDDVEYVAILAQLGYHFPGTAWEIAARYSSYDSNNTVPFPALSGSQHPFPDGSASEFAFAVNYYLNGHGNKLTIDAAFVSGQDAGSRLLFDPYTGYAGALGTAGTGDDDFGVLLRFQWQLAL